MRANSVDQAWSVWHERLRALRGIHYPDDMHPQDDYELKVMESLEGNIDDFYDLLNAEAALIKAAHQLHKVSIEIAALEQACHVIDPRKEVFVFSPHDMPYRAAIAGPVEFDGELKMAVIPIKGNGNSILAYLDDTGKWLIQPNDEEVCGLR